MKNKQPCLLILLMVAFASFNLFSEENASIAIIDVQAALLGTEASKQAFDDLSNSKEWKEVAEELQLKLNEAKEIQEKGQKEGPTMSDEDKMEAQKRLRSLSQDANFLNEKLNQMRNDLVNLIQQEQGPKFQKVVSELMRAKGIKIILHSNAVLGWDQGDASLNITPDVVDLLNQGDES